MFARGPPIASGYRGSRQITPLEDLYGPAERTNKNKSEYRKNKKNNGETTCVATNLRLYLNPLITKCNPKGSGNNNGHCSHQNKWISANDCHACRGSCWSESKPTRRFRAQSKQFHTGTKDFNRCSQPSASELIATIQKKNQTALLRKNNSHLSESAFQIAQQESSEKNQINWQVNSFWRKPAYGKAPGSKPDNCACVVMENFNSLGGFTNGVKINALNKLCRKCKTDI
jgi:hypothetical protein